VVNLIAGTTTRTGLTVRAELDHGVYEKGIKVTDREMKQLPPRQARISRRLELHHEEVDGRT